MPNKPAVKMITLTIDGKPVSVPEGTLVVDAAKKIGIDVPVFCYHPKMEPVGMCRMCLVEVGRPVIDRATRQPLLNPDGSPQIQFNPKLETACTTPVSEGMAVVGLSDKVAAARKEVIEFILTSHPLDCPICDKGGECPLQNLTMQHGPGMSRFLFDEKMHLAKHVPLGELIYLDRERCIQCGRCVRFQEMIADDAVIGFHNRGRALEIVTFSEPGFDSYFSGNTTDICPVGALTTADFRFGARPWELKPVASICSQCPVGCNVTFNVRREARSNGSLVIKRVLPRQNEAVNEIWMCDKGRFTAYQYTESPQRLAHPLVRKDGELVQATWEEALELVAARFGQARSSLVTLASGRLTNEDLFNLSELTASLRGKAVLDTFLSGGDLTAQMGVGKGSNFSELGPGDAILVVASDLEEEAPIWWLRVKQAAERGATLIVANPRPTKLDRYAAQSLRYEYGEEAAAILGMIQTIGSQKTRLPDWLAAYRPAAAVQAAARVFAAAANGIVIFGQEGMDLPASAALSQACANLLFVTDHLGKPNNGLIGVWPQANTQGAWDMGLRPQANLKALLPGAAALYVAGADPFGDDPSLAEALNPEGFLVVQELFLTETARRADVVLPAQAYTERDGSYTSGERRVQRFYPAVPPVGESRPDYAITAEIGKRLGYKLESVAGLVFNRIALQVGDYADLSYRKLAEVHEQWPIVGRGDMYYGGTSYENSQGLGVQLAPAAEKRKLFQVPWDKPAPRRRPGGETLWAVPVTRLYDQGRTVAAAQVLRPRLDQPHVRLHPELAHKLGIAAGAMVDVRLGGAGAVAAAVLDADIPAGIVLVPRSLGMPLAGPGPIELRLVDLQPA
jgi:NADH-quinone oxidoreductase subunit G